MADGTAPQCGRVGSCHILLEDTSDEVSSFFIPKHINASNVANKPSKDMRYNVYADAGLVADYPIAIFNTDSDNAAKIINIHTLGPKLERPEQIAYDSTGTGVAPYEIHTLRGYIGALYNLSMEQMNKGYSHKEEGKHTIYISTSNFSPRVRHISDKQKRMLFENGASAASAFFCT